MSARYQGAISGNNLIAEGTLSVDVELNEPMIFQAGQYVKFTLEGGEGDDSENSRYLSIASPPEERKRLTFATRLTGSKFKNRLSASEKGSPVTLEGPRGRFTIDGIRDRPAVFVTGGIGITPVRSILSHAIRSRIGTPLRLFYSSRSRKDAAFWKDMEDISARGRDIRTRHFLTGGGGRRITTKDIREDIGQEYRDCLFYVCGPPGLVVSIRSGLLGSGVEPARVVIESFAGY